MDNITWEKVLDMIIQSRESKGITKSELSKMIGTSLEFVSQMERRKKKPSIDTFIKIINSLEINFF